MFLTKKDRDFIRQQVDRIVDTIDQLTIQQEQEPEVITISSWVQEINDEKGGQFYSYMVQVPGKDPMISTGTAHRGAIVAEIWALSTALQMVQMLPDAAKYGIILQPSKEIMVECLNNNPIAISNLLPHETDKLDTLITMLHNYFKVKDIKLLTSGSTKEKLRQQFTKWRELQDAA